MLGLWENAKLLKITEDCRKSFSYRKYREDSKKIGSLVLPTENWLSSFDVDRFESS